MLRSPGVTKYMFVVVILNAVSSDVSTILKQGETRVFAQFCGGKPLNRRTKVYYLSTMVEGKMDPSHKIAAQQWIDFLRSRVRKLFWLTVALWVLRPRSSLHRSSMLRRNHFRSREILGTR